MSDYYDDYFDEFEDSSEDETEEDKKSTGGFTQVPNKVLIDDTLSIQARLLYCCLLSHAWSQDFCYLTQKRLGNYLGKSDRSVRIYLKELKNAGYINSHKHEFNGPNFYELLILPESKQFKKKYSDVFRNRRLKKVEEYVRTRRKKSS